MRTTSALLVLLGCGGPGTAPVADCPVDPLDRCTLHTQERPLDHRPYQWCATIEEQVALLEGSMDCRLSVDGESHALGLAVAFADTNPSPYQVTGLGLRGHCVEYVSVPMDAFLDSELLSGALYCYTRMSSQPDGSGLVDLCRADFRETLSGSLVDGADDVFVWLYSYAPIGEPVRGWELSIQVDGETWDGQCGAGGRP